MNTLIENKDLKWLFVSGKGGVGKTTCSSSIAMEFAKKRDKVLLVSTDPAHNLSDIFCQKIGETPCLVNNTKNLYCLEYDYRKTNTYDNIEQTVKFGQILSKLVMNIPGIEESMGYLKLLKKYLQIDDYSIIIFDTAPTGHTLKILNYPELLKEAYELLTGSALGNIFKQMLKFLYKGEEDTNNCLDKVIANINSINNKLTNVNYTTFVSVCIPEFLSVFETERFIQELYRKNIDCHIIIVNQVLTVEENSKFIKSRQAMQDKYLDMIDELYEDFKLIIIPLWEVEVRGIVNLQKFSEHLYDDFEYELDSDDLDRILDEALNEL